MKRFAIMLLAALIMSGCAATSSRTEGSKINKDSVLTIQPGSTTREMVIEKFGEPAETSIEGDEEKMTYRFKENKVPNYLGGVVIDEKGETESATTLELTIKDNVVFSYRYKSSEN